MNFSDKKNGIFCQKIKSSSPNWIFLLKDWIFLPSIDFSAKNSYFSANIGFFCQKFDFLQKI